MIFTLEKQKLSTIIRASIIKEIQGAKRKGVESEWGLEENSEED